MAKCDKSQAMIFYTPAVYHIRVWGKPGEAFWEAFQGLEVETKQMEDGQYASEMVVRIQDQSELIGMLHSFYKWHFTIRTLERIEKQEENLAIDLPDASQE